MLARSTDAQLTLLLHVVEFFPEDRSNEQIAPEDTDPEQYRMSRARAGLAEQAQRLEIEAAQEVVVSEHSAKHEIVRFAEERKMDLIVVASHGLHGISALLGSTANGVLHTASCDVLAVRAGA